MQKVKVINKETGIVKELNSELEASMYLATSEWELYKEPKKEEKKNSFLTSKED